jgi:hypothetical protein
MELIGLLSVGGGIGIIALLGGIGFKGGASACASCS